MMRRAEKLERAVWCKSMCESIVCYGFREGKKPEEYVDGEDRYLKDYIADLGKETVVAIMKDVVDNVVRIDEDVYTDSEGCTYNHIVYKDGYKEARYLKDALYQIWDETVGYKN